MLAYPQAPRARDVRLCPTPRKALASFHGCSFSRPTLARRGRTVLGRPTDLPGCGGSWIDERRGPRVAPEPADRGAADPGAGGDSRRPALPARPQQSRFDGGRPRRAGGGLPHGGGRERGPARRRGLPARPVRPGADHRHGLREPLPLAPCGGDPRGGTARRERLHPDASQARSRGRRGRYRPSHAHLAG